MHLWVSITSRCFISKEIYRFRNLDFERNSNECSGPYMLRLGRVAKFNERIVAERAYTMFRPDGT